MNRLALLLKREYWEHRGGFLWTPVWISAAILAVTVLGIISAEIFGQRADVHIGIALSQLRDHLDAAGLENLGNALDVSQLVFAAATSIGVDGVTMEGAEAPPPAWDVFAVADWQRRQSGAQTGAP